MSEMIDMLSRARLHPKFLELTPEPPLRNTKAFQKIFDQLLLRSNNEKKHRGAMLNLVTGQTNKCDWGFLNPGEQRSDRALRQEMSNKACLLVALAEGAGITAHVYSSPHLCRFNERIRLAGRLVDDAALADLLEEVETVNGAQQVTFFEVTTAAAMLAFSRRPQCRCRCWKC